MNLWDDYHWNTLVMFHVQISSPKILRVINYYIVKYSEIHLHLSLLACMTLVQAHWQSILYTIPSHILLYVVVCSKHLWINATGVAKHEYTINLFKFNILGRKIRILIMKYKTRDCVWTANAWIFRSPWCANVKTSAELLQFIMSWTLENVVY